MAYREVMMLEVKEVLRLWLSGVPKRQVAAQLGLDVKTVRRYLAAAQASGLRREQGASALEDPLVASVLAACARSWAGRTGTAGRCASRSAA
jgi:FixJ family two-component response regulator